MMLLVGKQSILFCYRYGAVGLSGGAFGGAPSSVHIWMDNVNCTGYENNIDECRFNGWGIHDCSHGEDAGVQCPSGTPILKTNVLSCIFLFHL